ncbi:TPA: hypothetical protein MBF00_000614 [Klebsiella aerogenes]|nr:hypothetical protein [Klebsiella aerogenes]
MIKKVIISLSVIGALALGTMYATATEYKCTAFNKEGREQAFLVQMKDYGMWLSVYKEGRWMNSGLLSEESVNFTDSRKIMIDSTKGVSMARGIIDKKIFFLYSNKSTGEEITLSKCQIQ